MPLEILVLALVQSPVAAAPQAPPAPPFVDDTKALPGVVTTCGSRAKDYIVEVDGGGVGLADFDGDGDLDLVVVDGSTFERVEAGELGFPPRLFLNDGTGQFELAPKEWELAAPRWGMGCAIGDIDGDGWPDLFVTSWGSNRVYINRDGKGFLDATLRWMPLGAEWSTSAAFLDFDRDGRLDLYVANYLDFDLKTVPAPGGDCSWKGHAVMCGPEGLEPQHDRLWRNVGPRGGPTGGLVEASVSTKVRPESAAFALGVMTLDYDRDGDTDIYVANDSTPNFLWENQGDGTFEEVGLERGVSHDMNGKEQAGMGIACGDIDGDGREDLLVTNFSGEANALYLSRGEHGFSERSGASGIAGPSMQRLGWGTALADFDLDGRLDSFAFNGHVYPQADRPGTDTSYAQPADFYRGLANARFAIEPLVDGPARAWRASTFGDIDGDGDLDLVALEIDGPVHVLRNRVREPGKAAGPHWISVELRSKGGNRFGLGGSVKAEWEGGQRTAEIRTSGGYQSSIPARAHFGLGASAKLKRLVATWPSGRELVLENVDADRELVLEEPEP